MYVEDLTKVVETAISTTKKKFGHGQQRIELGLFLQLAGLTANRPQAILDLRYRHILVSLLRDPQDGPHRIVHFQIHTGVLRYQVARTCK
jgi:Protein of unknown function (DUF3435)